MVCIRWVQLVVQVTLAQGDLYGGNGGDVENGVEITVLLAKVEGFRVVELSKGEDAIGNLGEVRGNLHRAVVPSVSKIADTVVVTFRDKIN